jgi:hypothetical protein
LDLVFFRDIFFTLLCGKGEFENAPKGGPLWTNFFEVIILVVLQTMIQEFFDFQIPPSHIPGPQSLGKKEICREGWDLGFIYPNETSPSLGEKASFQ